MQLDQQVRTVLSSARKEGNKLILVGTLDRSLYTRANKALEAAGGKWNRKAQAHIFAGQASEAIAGMLETGSIMVPRDDFEFFETPDSVLDIIMGDAAPVPGMLALEPSAGDGAIVRRLVAGGAIVDCCEIQSAKAAALRQAPGVRHVHACDFLATEPIREYDLVVMNPPFSKQADIKHTLHALNFVKEDGLLVSILASGAKYRVDSRATDFRELVASRGGVINELPARSFRQSGTDVNTIYTLIPGR